MNDLQIESGRPPVFLGVGHAGSKPSPSGPVSLLPEPSTLPGDDAIAGLLALESRSRSVSLNRAIRNINSLRAEQRAEWEKQKAALFEAARAQEDSGFWGSVGKICGTVGKVAGVVTAVAVAVGTGGAAVPLVLAVAGACLSTAALAQGEFEVLQKLGVDVEVAGWAELGIALAGIVATGGAALMGGASSVAQWQRVAGTAGKVSTMAAGGVTITGGIATAKKCAADADAQDYFADATSAHLEETRLGQMLLRILDDLEQSEKSYRHTVRTAKAAMDTGDNTLLIAVGRN